MGRYRNRLAPGAWVFSGSHNRVQLWLVGAHREAELEHQLRPRRVEEEEFVLDTPEDLGPLQFVKLRKQHSLVDSAWFCDLRWIASPCKVREPPRRPQRPRSRATAGCKARAS
ncbi:Hypothetical predicted protein [Marmota monax]|uniref:PLAT domain-containing protein n=1 Tax=Marmota monax TaxID=9995 RepID=A0A5E4BBC1_MARMO|nr:Hypothetical predicted protein [Marmota monax]